MRGVDGAGGQIADCYEASFPEQANVMRVIQLTPELAEIVSQHSAVAFVDARIDRSDESICVEPVSREADNLPSFSHVTSPTEIIALAQGIFGNAPPAVLVTTPTRDADMAIGERQLDDAVIREAVDVIHRWFTASARTRFKEAR